MAGAAVRESVTLAERARVARAFVGACSALGTPAGSPNRNDRWVLGDRNTGAYLVKHSWTGIVRHVTVAGTASPDDPDLEGYWGTRRRRARPAMGGTIPRWGQTSGFCDGTGSAA